MSVPTCRRLALSRNRRGSRYVPRLSLAFFNTISGAHVSRERTVTFMRYEDSHPSDQELLLEVDGELSTSDSNRVRTHLAICWKCRARRQELEAAIADFIRLHERHFDVKLPPSAGPRALLKAQLSQIVAAPDKPTWFEVRRRFSWPLVAAACALLALGFLLVRSAADRQNAPPMQLAIVSVPNSSITPGAIVLESRGEVCRGESTKNKAVPVALQRKVFAAYGIPGAEPRAYEVDYLITPALGGADDIRNLWPQSYSATVWNAQVKDVLEDYLHELVCDGSLDLAMAQREIATNWVAAYKKYFHTDRPLEEHREGHLRLR
jgi:anti-sigma factor RsiW